MNRYFAGPVKNTTETNTMQMVSVATNVGVAICAAPSSTASRKACVPMWRWMFSIVTVASSTRMPMAERKAAKRHHVQRVAHEAGQASELKMESGIETAMISVDRHEPRNRRIIMPVRQAAMTASRSTPANGGAHEDGLIEELLDLTMPGGAAARRRGQNVVLDFVDDIKGGNGAGLHDGQQHRRLAVRPNCILLYRGTIAHMADVADIHGGAIDHAYRERRSEPRSSADCCSC